MKYAIAFLASVVLIGCSGDSEMVPYMPMKMDDGTQSIVDDPALLTALHVKHVKLILKQYNVNFRVVSETAILIPSKIAKNRELIWNFTSKAELSRYADKN